MTIPVKTKTTRQYLDIYAIELETISQLSKKAQEKFRRQFRQSISDHCECKKFDFE